MTKDGKDVKVGMLLFDDETGSVWKVLSCWEQRNPNLQLVEVKYIGRLPWRTAVVSTETLIDASECYANPIFCAKNELSTIRQKRADLNRQMVECKEQESEVDAFIDAYDPDIPAEDADNNLFWNKTCSSCGSTEVKTEWQEHKFQYGLDKDAPIILTIVPARICGSCKFEYIDYVGEYIDNQAIENYKSSLET